MTTFRRLWGGAGQNRRRQSSLPTGFAGPRSRTPGRASAAPARFRGLSGIPGPPSYAFPFFTSPLSQPGPFLWSSPFLAVRSPVSGGRRRASAARLVRPVPRGGLRPDSGAGRPLPRPAYWGGVFAVGGCRDAGPPPPGPHCGRTKVNPSAEGANKGTRPARGGRRVCGRRDACPPPPGPHCGRTKANPSAEGTRIPRFCGFFCVVSPTPPPPATCENSPATAPAPSRRRRRKNIPSARGFG